MAFKASKEQTCDKCKGSIPVGSDYTWSRKGDPKYFHISCANPLDRILDEGPKPDPLRDQELPKIDPDPIIDLPDPIPTPTPSPRMADNKVAGSSEVLTGLMDLIQGAVDSRIASIDMKLDPKAIEAEVIAAVKKVAKPTLQIEIKDKLEVKKIEGIRHKQYPALLYLLANRQHVYLYGPSGSGKTKAAELAAMDLGLTYGYLSLNPQTPDSRIVGCRYADGGYRGTKFREAYELGHLYCFDEIDNASSALMATLNSALANGIGAFPDTMVAVHDSFRLVVTGNTPGYGANPAFPERRPLDAAVRDRFCFLLWDYDEEMERGIATGYNSESGAWVTWCHKLRAWATENMPKLQVTSRAIYRLAELSKDKFGPMGCKGAIDSVLFKGIDTASKKAILASNPVPEGI